MSDIVQSVISSGNLLGEVPVWDVREQALYWVDIDRALLQRFIPASGEVRTWAMPERLSGFALRADAPGIIGAFESGIGFCNPDTGEIDWIAREGLLRAGTIFNEGKVDRAGRFWAGSKDESLTHSTASLYRIDTDLSVTRMADGIGIANFFAWSLDNSRFWLADSLVKQVFAFDYEHATGNILNRSVFKDFADGQTPDGGTIDAEGFLWIAMWGNWKIVRLAADGSVDREIAMPVSQPTSCMFGGPDLRTLYVTSARWGLSPRTGRAAASGECLCSRCWRGGRRGAEVWRMTVLSRPDWIAVDWGTSNLRVWAMHADSAPSLLSHSNLGMGRLASDEFVTVLDDCCASIPDLAGIEVMVCGMAGARQGRLEAPYLKLRSICELWRPRLSARRPPHRVCSRRGRGQAPPRTVRPGPRTQSAPFGAIYIPPQLRRAEPT
ncbi:SMP-30/gluconolactonase/LRE family protein [Kaistia terrae]|uniref:SMP-30/gluconolactonase/LRE family protein n=1 Tax=Kaistia terrae TaxID=537017 RepID=A0ABW0Q1S2_9HYPH|nr:SMP-30/gluconolactonase/LRE family protein [Kaistia terrae]MCX5579620.1 SMP-30/gluconolactonase/LRE family protein [Kaistia terrae]